MWPGPRTTCGFVCIGAQARGLSCQVAQSKKKVSECLLWVGPCPRHSVCLCELDCVSWCVFLQKGVGPIPLSLPRKAPKNRAGDSSAPPTLTWSSCGQNSKEKSFGGKVEGGMETMRAPGQILPDSLAVHPGKTFGICTPLPPASPQIANS